MAERLRNIISGKVVLGAFCGISALAFVMGFAEYFFGDDLFGNESTLNLFLFAGAFVLLKSASSRQNKRLQLHCVGFAMLLSLVLLLGNQLYETNSLQNLFSSPISLIKTAIYLWGFTTVLGSILTLVLEAVLKGEEKPPAESWKLFKHPLLLWTILFLAWIPCYLAYYPGIFSYDVEIQTQQALGLAAISRFHPPLHTLWWRFCLMLEQNLGISALVFYSLTQMAMLAGAFTYVLRFMVRQRFNNWMMLVTLGFFALNPVIAIFSFIPTKDAMLAVFFVLYAVEICNFLADKQGYSRNIWSNLRLILFGLLSCLLRNNVVYGIVLGTLFMVLANRKWWKTFCLWCVSIVVGFALINGPIYTALGVQQGSSGEMLSVPMQQITCVVARHSGELSDSDKNAINEYLPVEELASRYNPRLADAVKGSFHSEHFDENPGEFVKLWFSLFLRYPMDYVEAFLNLNLPYWYPDACSIDSYSRRVYIETHIMDTSKFGYEVVRDSKLPGLYEKYSKVADYQAFMTKPLVSNLFAIGTPIWVLLVSMLILKIKRRADNMLPLFPAIGLWMTFMLGPVSNFRYMYPIIVLYPLYLALALQPIKEPEETIEKEAV